MPIFWDSSFEFGNELIDQQHMRLVSIFNILEETCKEHQNYQTCKTVLENFKDYIDYHLDLENAVKENFKTASLENHIIAHRALSDKIQRFYNRFDMSDEEEIYKVLDYFKQSLLDHIRTEKNAQLGNGPARRMNYFNDNNRWMDNPG